ncbi:hypothetical protein E4U60_001205 [Claviceps pazoutovae]|uniref:Sialidase n=1 Tax=Claviceps pazoutovae TaxID=1649127 RepID=A0A9P7MD79_9HYPO|nr:hypothetical protein E4U60_001205 [Claviceps pazoutovae]
MSASVSHYFQVPDRNQVVPGLTLVHDDSLVAGVPCTYTFPSSLLTLPSQNAFLKGPSHTFNPSFLDLSYAGRHVRSPSKPSSVHSTVSTVESSSHSVSSPLSTPPRVSSPVRHHGPVLLPRIRPQDQHLEDTDQPLEAAVVSTKKESSCARNTTPARGKSYAGKPIPSGHMRSGANADTLSSMAYAHLSSFSCTNSNQPRSLSNPAPLLPPAVSFGKFDNFDCSDGHNTGIMTTPRRASSCFSLDINAVGGHGYPMCKPSQLIASSTPSMSPPPPNFVLSSFDARDQSSTSLSGTPEPVGLSTTSTILISYLMMANPAASLVRTISFPKRDASIKHFWWDIRNIRAWSSFNAQAVFAFPGASAQLTTPVSASLLPHLHMPNRTPETEASLHSIYASYYLPKLNAALAVSSDQPLQFSVPAKSSHSIDDLLFVVNTSGESFSPSTMFGGKPVARVVGLVRSFDRFNTGMRSESNVKRVEYLRGLAALHHAMREHSCRYGFILTEIELVLVRCGTESTPYFGHLEITSVRLSNTSDTPAENHDAGFSATSTAATSGSSSLTACLALWGLCQLAGHDTPAGQPHWKTEIGAPADGTRRKAKPRDNWMPQPQLAEKREAKRSRGWIWPEDAVGRKEMGKRGVKYNI